MVFPEPLGPNKTIHCPLSFSGELKFTDNCLIPPTSSIWIDLKWIILLEIPPMFCFSYVCCGKGRGRASLFQLEVESNPDVLFWSNSLISWWIRSESVYLISEKILYKLLIIDSTRTRGNLLFLVAPITLAVRDESNL